jgi:protease-4
MWDEYRAHIVRARPDADLDAATTGLVETLAANDGDMAQVALAVGLADTIGTHDEWGARIAELAGEDEWSDHPGAFASTDLDTWIAASAGDEGGDGLRGFGGESKRIGVITVAGEISDGEAGPGSAGAARITRLLEDALDDDLAALVVRIDSPGGTVTGSESIRRAVMRFRDKDIPVVVSMGNYAASGGYWIATAGQRIFAEPETLTGSIGVILFVPSFEEIMADYGVNSESIRTTPLSGQPDLLGGFTPETEALLQAETEAIYGRFVGLVAEARNITPVRADELAQGRVWTGGSARQLGLVDQFGGLDAALEWAAAQAGLEDEDQWEPRFLTSPPDPFEAMLAGVLGGGEAQANPQALVSVSSLFARQEQQVAARVLADLDRLMTAPGVQALCLGCAPETPLALPGARQAASPWWSVIAARFLAH